ncbi:MAG: pyridoxamine 5'-phosphate oxidase [Pseudanabaena frigida]|uniref:Pyridoxamine 5'-phosphate oxidase n=1 Tax=Pseudanabaena frigida TaxID=945775 RepID=A0A2W4WJ75_9CYAN|nr:MAG: pyridoxamine 5'-phosphate oxidase [Pseudanabaena frigida]
MWRSHLARSLHQHRNQPESRFLQLATIDLDQRPRNRTLVFRGFLENSDRFKDCLKIVTDYRSQKVAQIANNPWAEVNWYFTKTRSQFRIFGKLILIDQECPDLELQSARKLAWQSLSEPARIQFAWAHPREPRVDFSEVTPPDPHEPISSFCLLLLEPIEVDRLELRGTPQNRWLYLQDRQGNWTEQEVNP